ncbi:hypothetical protein ACIOC1_34295 [Streptomyces sp. NPDC088197]|uniref:hypothetical protein n=1 Tax=Streptomyces sp. NPDC088197 TaxID=3365840 RepID=UPI0037F84DDF
MFRRRQSTSSYPLPVPASTSAGGGCVIDANTPRPGFGFTRRAVRWQLAALTVILLATMVVLGFAVEVTAALLAAVLAGVAIDAITGAAGSRTARRAAPGRSAR